MSPLLRRVTQRRDVGPAWIFAAASVALATAWSPAVRRVDNATLGLVRSVREESWRRPAAAISALGETPVMVALLATASAQHPRQAARDLSVLGTALAGRAIVCRALRRPRPDASGWWSEPTGFSMPSRHTMTAVLGLSLAADRLADRRPGRWQRTARLTGALVAGSRIVLGVHWPTDTLSGYLLGVGMHTTGRASGRTTRH